MLHFISNIFSLPRQLEYARSHRSHRHLKNGDGPTVETLYFNALNMYTDSTAAKQHAFIPFTLHICTMNELSLIKHPGRP